MADTILNKLYEILPCKVGDIVYKHWKVGGNTVVGKACVTGFETEKALHKKREDNNEER